MPKSVPVVGLIFGLSQAVPVPLADNCRVSEPVDGVTRQVCPATESVEVVADIRTYRGLVVDYEMRLGNISLCRQFYKLLSIESGGTGTMMRGQFGEGPFPWDWSYDGAVCRFSQHYGVETVKAGVDHMLAPKVDEAAASE